MKIATGTSSTTQTITMSTTSSGDTGSVSAYAAVLGDPVGAPRAVVRVSLPA